MVGSDLFFILLHFAVLLILVLTILIFRTKNKGQIHYIFLINMVLILIWSIGNIIEVYATNYYKYTIMPIVYIWFFGLCFLPLSLLFTGLIYAYTKVKFNWKHGLLFIPPITSYLVLITNSQHHLFFVNYSFFNDQIIYGEYFIFHSIHSYIYIIYSLYLFIYFSVKNSGFFSKQSSLIFLGIAMPFFVNLAFTFKIINLPQYATPIAFSFTIICFSFAIFRFKFLNVVPIALQNIVDRISDGYLVVNDELQVIDYNKPMLDTFNDIICITRNINLGQILEKVHLGPEDGSILDFITDAKLSGSSLSYNKHIRDNNFDRYFRIEITPIISKQNFLGTIILFKDTTENVKAIATIEEKHSIMMEQERLASLGQLIGGIAHNLKTPIMSIAGAIEGLRDLVAEYEASIGDNSVTEDDHREIASEMRSWLDKMKPYCAYMSDVIDTVKGQTMQASAGSMFGFTLNELVKRIELLLKYELIRYKCKMNTTINVDINTEFYGDVNSLVQVFDNIIINAIQAYGGKNGLIDFTVDETGGDILFAVKDYAKGIPERIKGRLLKEMVTTKGKHGTGLGLYMSNSTIKGRFGGRMWFESETGKGTTFFIQIPRKKQAV